MGKGTIKEGDGIFHQIYIDLEEVLKVGESSIHESKSWYYLGSFQTFKVELFVQTIFVYKPLTYFAKIFNLDVSLVLSGASNKYFLCLVNGNFVL